MSDVSLEKRLEKKAWSSNSIEVYLKKIIRSKKPIILAEDFLEELRVSAEKIRSKITELRKEQGQRHYGSGKGYELSGKIEAYEDVLKELVEPESFSVKDSPKNSKESNV